MGGRTSGHWWTIRGRLERQLARPAHRDWSTSVEDPKLGQVRIRGHYFPVVNTDTLVICVHGLGGSVDSPYLSRAIAAVKERRWSALLLGRRGSEGDGEDCYHAGHTADFAAAMNSPTFARYKRIFFLGYSLGGHSTLWLAHIPTDPRLQAIAAICAPVHLESSQKRIDQPSLWIYRRFILRGLLDQARVAARRGRLHLEPDQLAGIRTFFQFDDRVVAPRHGFLDAADYYAKASATNILDDLAIPTLLVEAEPDPVVNKADIAPFLPSTGTKNLTVCWLPRGGHAFFPTDLPLFEGDPSQPLLETAILAWLDNQTLQDRHMLTP